MKVYAQVQVPQMYQAEIPDAQRAAISAHWSAELRRKVEAGKERERHQVVVDWSDE